jgi:hypothetical protein
MPQFYEIRVKGHLDESWADWLHGLVIRHENSGETLLLGFLPDQAALHGVLNRLRDLGIELISVNPIEKSQATGETDLDPS